MFTGGLVDQRDILMLAIASHFQAIWTMYENASKIALNKFGIKLSYLNFALRYFEVSVFVEWVESFTF